jgi:hypothetical protein
MDDSGNVLARCADNCQSRQLLRLDPPAVTESLTVAVKAPSSDTPAALFAVRCYG